MTMPTPSAISTGMAKPWAMIRPVVQRTTLSAAMQTALPLGSTVPAGMAMPLLVA